MIFYLKPNKKQIKKVVKIFILISLLTIFIVGFYFILKYTKIFKKFNSLQEVKNLIKSAGFWSYSVFAVLQFLQVTLLPLPASLTTIAGVIIFGPFIAFIISTLSIILGSLFAYFCGKFLKEKVLKNFLTKKTKNYQKIFENGNLIFFIMMLFPFFPDDILCIFAGLTNMDFKFFLLTNLFTRPIGLFCLCFLGSGKIIPFSSWGIAVWAIIAIIFIVLTVFYLKYKKKIIAFLKNFYKKHLYINLKKNKKYQKDNL